MLENTRAFNVDCIAYDLEFCVVPSRKQEARNNLYRFLQTRSAGVKENAIRINAVDTGLALHDLTEVVCPPFPQRLVTLGLPIVDMLS